MRHQVGMIAFFFITMGFSQLGSPTLISEQLNENDLIQRPEFYILDWKDGTKLKEKPTKLSIEIDYMGLKEVNVLVDTENRYVLYTSDILSPVCADGVCRLMEIRLYWTLLGEYAGFDYYRNAPLTKHNHDEFIFSDYLKLHQLLMDNNSILKRRKIDELVKKPKWPEMVGVDALAGATIKEIKESVVDGALYSCYTAWHLVHGPIKDEIKNSTLSLLDDDMVLRMLDSNNTDYQMFAMKKLTENQYEANYLRIAEIFESGIPLLRAFIVKNLPDSFWNSEELQKPFWKSFSKVDINSRSLLLNHLTEVSEVVLEDLSKQLNVMTKNQINEFLKFLDKRESLSPRLMKNLTAFVESKNDTYAYLVKYFLEGTQKKGKK